MNQGRSQRAGGKWRNGWTQDKEKRGKMNELRRLSHLASVWIIRYCYSCGASRCAQPQAACKSWMTIRKDSDKLIDFCEGVKRHSAGSFIDGCARCLLGDARDILVSDEGCFSAQGPRPCQDYRKMMWIRFGDRFYFLPGFCSGKQSVVSTSQRRASPYYMTWTKAGAHADPCTSLRNYT